VCFACLFGWNGNDHLFRKAFDLQIEGINARHALEIEEYKRQLAASGALLSVSLNF
jgi:hypothetical protein